LKAIRVLEILGLAIPVQVNVPLLDRYEDEGR
jgi:hypothetical protein